MAKEAKAVRLDEVPAFVFIVPRSFGGIVGALGENNIIIVNIFLNEALWVRDYLLIPGDGLGGWEGGNDRGVSMFKIPEEMKVSIGQNHKAAFL